MAPRIAAVLGATTALAACGGGAEATVPAGAATKSVATSARIAQSAVARSPVPLRWRATQRLSVGPAVNGGTPAPFPTSPSVGVDARGGAVVTWSAPRRRGQRPVDVLLAVARPGARFGPVQRIAEGDNPKLAVASNGDVMLAYTRRDGRVTIARGTVDAGLKKHRTLGLPQGARVGRFGRTRYSASTGGVALAGDGTAIVVTVTPTRRASVAEVHVLPSSGAPAAPRRLPAREVEDCALITGPDGSVILRAGDRLFTRSLGGDFDDGVRVPVPIDHVAVAPDGHVGVVGLEQLKFSETGGAFGRVLLSERPAGTSAFSAQRRAPIPRDASAPALAYDGASRPVVAWIRDRVTDPFEETEAGEEAFGAAEAWAGGAALPLGDTAADVLTAGLPGGGVLIVTDGARWSSAVVEQGAVRRVRGPIGRPLPSIDDRGAGALAAGPRRAVLAWEGDPDHGVRVALADLT